MLQVSLSISVLHYEIDAILKLCHFFYTFENFMIKIDSCLKMEWHLWNIGRKSSLGAGVVSE